MIFDIWRKNAEKRHISNKSLLQKEELFTQLIKDIDQKNKKLLLVGSVQSGKTSTFIGLISKLFDLNLSNLVIMFAGVTHKLVDQTEERFREIFKSENNVEIIKSLSKDTDFLDITEKLCSGKKVILLSIKHYQHINYITHWFNNCKTKINPLVIDDEGDQASFYNIKKYSIDGDHSATYNSFTKFFDLDRNCTFLSVTATPQAHILAHREFCALDPDFVYLAPDGEEYLTYQELSMQKGVFKTLSEDDIEELTISKKDEQGQYQLLSLPESVKYAIIQYFVSHKKWYIEKKNGWFPSQMIINVDKKIKVHYSVKAMIKEFIDKFELSETYRNQIIDLLYANESEAVKKLYLQYALDIIKSDEFELRCLNCYNKDEKYRDIQGRGTKKQCNIIIGGLTISRGVSFPNLLSFYYINEKPKTYTMDNIIQVCRFLGYRKEQLSYFNIWMSKKIQELLWSMFNADQWIREQILFYQRHHYNFRKCARFIRIQIKADADYNIIGTRQTVAKQIKASGIGKSLANDASFNFKSDKDIALNDQMLQMLNILIKLYLSKPEKHISNELGDDFGDYPILYFDSFANFTETLRRQGINNPDKILTQYFKEAVYCKDVITYLQNSKEKLIIGLMLYKMDKKGNYVSRDIAYSPGSKEFSFYRQGIRTGYIGDNNWANQYFLQKNIKVNFIQLFSINPPTLYSKLIDDKKVIKMQIVLPSEMDSAINDTVIAAEDEELVELEKEVYKQK